MTLKFLCLMSYCKIYEQRLRKIYLYQPNEILKNYALPEGCCCDCIGNSLIDKKCFAMHHTPNETCMKFARMLKAHPSDISCCPRCAKSRSETHSGDKSPQANSAVEACFNPAKEIS